MRLARPLLSAGLLVAALALGGCATQRPGPDALELANLRPWNAVPATSPARLVSTFERVCLDGRQDPEGAAAALRAMDYVEAPRRRGSAARVFLVDDARPAVLIGAEGRSCALAARARTGQATRIATMVARRFPGARMVEPARIGPRTEAAWATPGGGLIVLNRVILPGRPSELLLIRLRG
jgi:hypothetical protein